MLEEECANSSSFLCIVILFGGKTTNESVGRDKAKLVAEFAENFKPRRVSVNQLSVHRAVLIWYFGRRCGGDSVAPNTNVSIAQNLVTNFTRYETQDLFDLASITRSRSVHNRNNSVEFESWGQVSREARFPKLVEVGENFVTRPVIRLAQLGITTMYRENYAMRDDSTAEAQVATVAVSSLVFPVLYPFLHLCQS